MSNTRGGGLFADRPGEDGLPLDAAPYDAIGHRAVWSDDMRHRFILWRDWGPKCLRNFVQVIGLNPSTATEEENDPTLRRVIAFAKREGAAGLVMTNRFSFRSTNPNALYEMLAEQHRLKENDRFLRDVAKYARLRIAAWGTHGDCLGRAAAVVKMMEQDGRALHCLGRNKDGSPRHPLYVPANQRLELFLET